MKKWNSQILVPNSDFKCNQPHLETPLYSLNLKLKWIENKILVRFPEVLALQHSDLVFQNLVELKSLHWLSEELWLFRKRKKKKNKLKNKKKKFSLKMFWNLHLALSAKPVRQKRCLDSRLCETNFSFQGVRKKTVSKESDSKVKKSSWSTRSKKTTALTPSTCWESS